MSTTVHHHAAAPDALTARSTSSRLPFIGLVLVLGSALVCRDAAADDSLAQAYKIIASKRFVDLTHSFSPTTPVWSGFGQATFTAAADPSTGRPYTLEKDSFRTMFFSLPGQYGTHVDPPAHFAEQGLTVDQIPLKQMILPLVVFDVTPLLAREPNHALTVDDVKAWEKAHGQVPAGSFAAQGEGRLWLSCACVCDPPLGQSSHGVQGPIKPGQARAVVPTFARAQTDRVRRSALERPR